MIIAGGRGRVSETEEEVSETRSSDSRRPEPEEPGAGYMEG